MFQKISLALTLVTLLLSTTAWAQKSDNDMDKSSYCYGVYSATKDKSEVAKNNSFLKMAGVYTKIINSPSYQKGYSKAAMLDKKQKSSCYLVAYGYLGMGYSMAGQKDTKTNLDLAYCMGYVNQAREVSDREMAQEFCDTEKNLNAEEKKQCIIELSQITKQNSPYQAGRREAQTVNPIRVMNCGMKISASSEKELNKAMGTRPNAPQPPRKKTPQKKDTITTPIFR